MPPRGPTGPSKYQLALLKTGIDVARGVTLPEELPDNIEFLADESDLTAARVQYVSQLMVRGIFAKKKHPPVLAKKWAVSEKKIRQIVDEADRNVRIYSSIDQQETLKELNAIGHSAIQRAMEQGNMLAVAQLLRVVGEHSLDKRSQRVEVAHEIRSLTDQELERRRIDLTSKLIARLPAEQKQALFTQSNQQAAPIADAEYEEEKTVPSPPDTLKMIPDNEDG